jgi:ABC-2 type transport system ATP-binding protein
MSTIELGAVSRWFGNVVAVNDVTMIVGPGVTGLLGPNGAGKSTLLSMMSGFLPPSSGSVTLDGTPIWRNPDMYRMIGLVPEAEAMYDSMTGEEFVLANARLHKLANPAKAAIAALEQVDMMDSRDRKIGEFSKGMKQRIKMATALVHSPKVLLLDEPFNGMDPRQRLQMMDLLRQMAAEGRTILFSSHILEEVERLAERVLVIVAGRLAASGDFREIRRLMTDRPHTFTVRSSDDRAMAAALMADPTIGGVTLDDGMLVVRTADYGAFSLAVAGHARRAGISLYEMSPTDESLESVFSYLVRR